MKTRTLPEIVRKVYGALGRSGVMKHDPTAVNKVGQSGVHTFVDDVVDIVLDSANDCDARCRLNTYLQNGNL